MYVATYALIFRGQTEHCTNTFFNYLILQENVREKIYCFCIFEYLYIYSIVIFDIESIIKVIYLKICRIRIKKSLREKKHNKKELYCSYIRCFAFIIRAHASQ